jgi:hypothetical protein
MLLHLFMVCVAAFVLAAWVFVIALFVCTFGLVPVRYAVVLAHALGLGLPIFLIFWWKRWVNIYTCMGAGFLVAAASGIHPNWPVGPEGRNSSVGGVDMVVDGVPTLAGWIDFLQVLAFVGFFGAIAGIVFWAILSAFGALTPAGTGIDGAQRRRATSLGVGAVLVTAGLMAIPGAAWERLFRLAEDQTCHNVLLDRDSISPQVSMELQIAREDVPQLTAAMQDFAAARDLQYRDASEPDRLDISFCNDRGLTISLDTLVSISVFERQSGSGWQQTTKELIDRIETLWPGKLLFSAPQGGYMPRPQELQ